MIISRYLFTKSTNPFHHINRLPFPNHNLTWLMFALIIEEHLKFHSSRSSGRQSKKEPHGCTQLYRRCSSQMRITESLWISTKSWTLKSKERKMTSCMQLPASGLILKQFRRGPASRTTRDGRDSERQNKSWKLLESFPNQGAIMLLRNWCQVHYLLACQSWKVIRGPNFLTPTHNPTFRFKTIICRGCKIPRCKTKPFHWIFLNVVHHL